MDKKAWSRITVIVVVSALIVGATGFFYSEELLADYQRPAVLLISACSLRADLFSRNANTGINQLKLLKQEGVWFERAYSTSNRTAASLASILSGEPVGGHGVQHWGDQLLQEKNRFAQLGARLGYPCAAFTGRNVVTALGVNDDFDVCGAGDLPDSAIGGELIGWLAAAVPRGKPFVAWLHFAETGDAYAGQEAPLINDQPSAKLQAQLSVARRQKLDHDYWSAVDRFDYRLGHLLLALRARGYNRNNMTLVIVGDHGETLEESGAETWYGHRNSFRPETVHVPLLWVSSQCQGGQTNSTEVSLTDILPTLWGVLRAGGDSHGSGRNLFIPTGERVLPLTTVDQQNRLRNGLIIKDWFYRYQSDGAVDAMPLVAQPVTRPLAREAAALHFARAFPDTVEAEPAQVDFAPGRAAIRALGYLQ